MESLYPQQQGGVARFTVQGGIANPLSRSDNLEKSRRGLWSFSSTPLVLTYGAFPLVDIGLRVLGRPPFRSWIDGAWILLFLLATLQLILRLERPLRIPRVPTGLLVAAPLVLLVSLVTLEGPSFVSATYAMELKPVFYLVVAWIWVLAFGFPSRRAFIQAGLLLSALIAMELVSGSALHRSIFRPIGSGEVNYDACLILLSLCVGLADESVSGFQLCLLCAGILATFSRTGAMAVMVILLICRRVPSYAKLAAIGFSAGSAVLSFLVRGLDSSLSQVDRYLMWASAIEMFYRNPSGLAFGYGVGAPLPAEIPPGLTDLFSMQDQSLSLSGTYAFEYHSMWLRMEISWGIVVLALILTTAIAWILQSRVLLRRYLALALCLEGLSMGVVYLSNVGIPFFILVMLACQDRAAPQELSARRGKRAAFRVSTNSRDPV